MSTASKTEGAGTKRVVAITGRIDINSHTAFQGAYDLLDDPQVGEIHLDCSNITHFESSGLGLLLIFKEKARLRRKRVLILNPSPAAKLQFEMAFMGNTIPIMEQVVG